MKVYARDAMATDSDLVWLAKMLVQTYELRACREGNHDQVVRRIVGNCPGGCGREPGSDEHYDFRVEGRFVKWERGPRRGRTALLELVKLAGRYGNDELCAQLREVDVIWRDHVEPLGWSYQPPKPGTPEWDEKQRKRELHSLAYDRWRTIRDAWWALAPEGQGSLFDGQ
jgi:hypothetical protein